MSSQVECDEEDVTILKDVIDDVEILNQKVSIYRSTPPEQLKICKKVEESIFESLRRQCPELPKGKFKLKMYSKKDSNVDLNSLDPKTISTCVYVQNKMLGPTLNIFNVSLNIDEKFSSEKKGSNEPLSRGKKRWIENYTDDLHANNVAYKRIKPDHITITEDLVPDLDNNNVTPLDLQSTTHDQPTQQNTRPSSPMDEACPPSSHSSEFGRPFQKPTLVPVDMLKKDLVVPTVDLVNLGPVLLKLGLTANSPLSGNNWESTGISLKVIGSLLDKRKENRSTYLWQCKEEEFCQLFSLRSVHQKNRVGVERGPITRSRRRKVIVNYGPRSTNRNIRRSI
jgi:hypothetical protein